MHLVTCPCSSFPSNFMTSQKRSSRARQRAIRHGAGALSLSPLKARDSRKRNLVVRTGLRFRLAANQARQAQLETSTAAAGDETPLQDEPEVWVDEPTHEQDASMPIPADVPLGSAPKPQRERICRLADSWKGLLPLLEAPLSCYLELTHGRRPLIIESSIRHDCMAACVETVVGTIQCLYISRAWNTMRRSSANPTA